MRTLRIAHLLFLPLLSPALAAQDLAPTRLAQEDGRLLGRSSDVAAAFEPGAVRFAASDAELLGGSGLTYRMESVQLGRRTLHRAAGDVAAFAAGETAEYHHSEDLVERYEVRAEGIEQTFVFHSLPNGTGDLVVRGRLGTDLEAISSDPIDGLVFSNGLRYGGVTGIDASGATAPGTIRLEGDVLELALPADFVATAELPLVLDPVIGSLIGPIVRQDSADGSVDVAFSGGRYFVVWKDVEDRGANPDWYSVSGIWLDGNGNVTAGPFAIWTNQVEEIYEVSNGVLKTGGTTHYLVAWSRSTGIHRDVQMRRFSIDQTTVDPHLDLGATIFNEVHPDVTKLANGSATVVWERIGDDIEGAEIGVNGVGKPVILEAFDVSGDTDDHRPRIARINGQNLAVWHRDTSGSTTEHVMGRAWTGNEPDAVLNPEFTIDTGTLGYRSVDCAASAAGDFYVVWDYGYLGSGGDTDIYGRRVIFPAGLDAAPTIGTRDTLQFDSLDDHSSPRIMFTGNAYVVSYQRELVASYTLDAIVLDPMSIDELESIVFAASGSPFGDHALGTVDFTALNNDRVMGAYTTQQVFCRRMETKGGSAQPLNAGCTIRGGELRASTLTSPNPGFQVELWGGEIASGAYLAVGDAPLNLPIGGATLVPDPLVTASYFVGVTTIDGYASFDLPIPAGLSGGKAWLQWIVLAPGGTCTPYPVNLSDGLQIQLD